MKHERLTEYGSNGKAFYADLKHDTIRVGVAIDRLAELEDKIERGELVEVPRGAVVLTPEERAEEMRLCNEERKQAVRDVLLTMLERMDRLTGCGVPYHVKKFINDIAVENGIELVTEVCGDET